jgi:hypothetical protein
VQFIPRELVVSSGSFDLHSPELHGCLFVGFERHNELVLNLWDGWLGLWDEYGQSMGA